MAKRIIPALIKLTFYCLLQSTFGLCSHASGKIVISHADIFLFLYNKCSYDIEQSWDEDVPESKMRRKIKAELTSCFSKLKVNEGSCSSQEELGSFLTNIGLKQKKELINNDEFLRYLDPLPIESYEVNSAFVNIINGIEEAVKSYFDDRHYYERKRLKDVYIKDEPYIFITLSYLQNSKVLIIGAPGALQNLLYPHEIYCDALVEKGKGFRIFAVMVAFFSIFTPSVNLKFPSFPQWYGEQQIAQLPRDSAYAALGLAAHASQAEIKVACNDLYLKYHPDKNHDPNAANKFHGIRSDCELLLKK